MLATAANPFQELIDQYGEEPTRQYLRAFYADPNNIAAFAMLFSNHVPTYPPDFHLEILDYFTQTTGNVGGAAPRGFAKSTITSLVYLGWRTLNASSRFSILISDTYTQAVDLLAGLKDELETNDVIKWLYGDVIGDSWAEDDIEVIGIDSNGKRLPCRIIALGAGMKVRGRKFKQFRPQLVIIDDLENDEAVQSKERREKLRKWFTRAVLPAIDRVIGRVILIGTTLHKRALLSAIINNEDEFKDWTTFKYSAITNGRSLWEKIYSTAKLIAMRDDPRDPNYIGVIAFAQEMQNNPLDEGAQIIKSDWIADKGYSLAKLLNDFEAEHPDTTDLLGDWLNATFSLIHSSVDPAISEKETADYWTQVTIGITKNCPLCKDGGAGHILILDYIRMRESDPLIQINSVLDNFELWQEDRVRLEVVAYQAGLVKLIKREMAKRRMYVPLKPFRPVNSKVRRMNVHAANFSGGLVHHRLDHPLAQAFIDELLEFPQGEHDDLVDAYMGAADISLKRRGRTGTIEAK